MAEVELKSAEEQLIDNLIAKAAFEHIVVQGREDALKRLFLDLVAEERKLSAEPTEEPAEPEPSEPAPTTEASGEPVPTPTSSPSASEPSDVNPTAASASSSDAQASPGSESEATH